MCVFTCCSLTYRVSFSVLNLICLHSSMFVFLLYTFVHWLHKDSHALKYMDIVMGTFLSDNLFPFKFTVSWSGVKFYVKFFLYYYSLYLVYKIPAFMHCQHTEGIFQAMWTWHAELCTFRDRFDLNKLKIWWKAMSLHTLNCFLTVVNCGSAELAKMSCLHYIIF